MGVLVRLARALPLVLALAVLALVLYVVISWTRSPNRAKEILIQLFTVLSAVLSVVFALGTTYALFENNTAVLELAGAFLGVSLLTLLITRLCRQRFIRNHPNYATPAHRTWFIH